MHEDKGKPKGNEQVTRPWRHNLLSPDPDKRPDEIRDWLRVVFMVLACLAIVWAAVAVHQSNSSGKLATVQQNAIDATEQLKGLVSDARPAVQKLAAVEDGVVGIEDETRGMIRDIRGQAAGTFGEINGAAVQFRSNLASIQGVTDQARVSLFDNGGLVPNVNAALTSPGRRVWPGFTAGAGLIPSLTVSAGHVSDVTLLLRRTAEGLPTLIGDADGVLTGFKAVEVSADGAIRGLTPIEANLAGLTDELHGEAKDIHTFTHQKLFPGPVHGFWGHTKQVFQIVSGPVLEGFKTYYLVNPVIPKVIIPPAK